MLSLLKLLYYHKKARNYSIKKEWLNSLKYSEKGLKICPNLYLYNYNKFTKLKVYFNLYLYNYKGLALLKLDKYSESEMCFRFIISKYKCLKDDSLQDVFLAATTNYATLLSQLGRSKEALVLNKQVLKLDPNRKVTINNIKIDLFNSIENISYEDFFESVKINFNSDIAKKVIESEIETYNEILKKDPKNIITLINKGTALAEIDKFDESIDNYNKALKIDPTNLIALLNRAGTFGRMGNYEKSIKYFSDILKIHPKNKKALDGKKLAEYYKSLSKSDLDNYFIE